MLREGSGVDCMAGPSEVFDRTEGGTLVPRRIALVSEAVLWVRAKWRQASTHLRVIMAIANTIVWLGNTKERWHGSVQQIRGVKCRRTSVNDDWHQQIIKHQRQPAQ